MTWPMEQAVLTQTLRNLLLLKKSMQTMQAQTDQLRSQLQDLKRIQKAKGPAHAAARHDGAGRAPLD